MEEKNVKPINTHDYISEKLRSILTYVEFKFITHNGYLVLGGGGGDSNEEQYAHWIRGEEKDIDEKFRELNERKRILNKLKGGL